MSLCRYLQAALVALPLAAPCALAAGSDTARTRHLDDDEITARLVDEVPGFGGVFYEDGVKYVYLKEMDSASRAREIFDAEPIQATYDFRELLDYRNRAIATASRHALTFIDLDEKHNLVRVGVDPLLGKDAISAVEDDFLAQGFPPGSFVVEERAAPRQDASVRDRIRPLSGGTEISYGNSLCTLGFNSYYNGLFGWLFGIVTNSHCVGSWGAGGGTVKQGGESIGFVGINPPLFTGDVCPVGRECRYSDTAWVLLSPQETRSPRITRTEWLSTTIANPPYVEVTTASPVFPIVVGQWVNKTGRTSGGSGGYVTQTCVSSGVAGQASTLLLCQYFADYISQPGDSGSPIFREGDSPLGGATILGINWGSLGGTGVFSPWSGILAATDLRSSMVLVTTATP